MIADSSEPFFVNYLLRISNPVELRCVQILDNTMNSETKKRISIANAAAELYLSNPGFSIHTLAKNLKMNTADIFDLFPNRFSILRYFYTSRIIIIQENTAKITDYTSFSVSEKLSNLFLLLIEQFEEHREFVIKTYSSLNLVTIRSTEFEKELRTEIQTILENDPNISLIYSLLPDFILHRLFTFPLTGIIYFWMEDESRNREDTIAFIDKWASFSESLLYSQIADKGFDLARFLFYRSTFSSCLRDQKQEQPNHE